MRAVVLTRYGDPDVLAVAEIPDPVLGPEEILVRIRCSALNRADVLQRMGLYAGPKADHEIPGLEFAGTVVGCGERVLGRAAGDVVMGIVGGGGYAELIAVHERQVMPVPSTVLLEEAAAIPEVWMTAYDALILNGGLTAGRLALVHAGASGVGTAAIQIAKGIGARVAVTVSGAKVEACRALGADLVIDYGREDFVEAVRSFTKGGGADVILDVVGGEYAARNIACVAPSGAIVQVGTMGSGMAEINLLALMGKRARLVGTVLRARPIEEKIALTQRFAAEMLPLFEAGRFRPVIDSRFPLDAAADAHRHMEANANVGKILLDL